jgi:hypothetical protein
LVPAVHQIVFRKQLAKEMMYNELNESDGIRHSPIRARKRFRESLGMEHKLMTMPTYTGAWDPTVKRFKKVSTEYLKLEPIAYVIKGLQCAQFAIGSACMMCKSQELWNLQSDLYVTFWSVRLQQYMNAI